MENPFEENKLQRPAFLMVLCILTFVSCGWSVLSNLFSLFTVSIMNSAYNIEQYSSMMGTMEDQGVSSFLSGFLSSSIELLQVTVKYAKEIAIMQLVLSVISLVGAIMMFHLKRPGFYLYAAAQIIMLLVIPYLAGFTISVVTALFFSTFFTVLFIVLYAVNLKYMNR